MDINSDWVSNAAEGDAELWEAQSAEHCPPPPSSPITPSQSMNGEHLFCYECICICICICNLLRVLNLILRMEKNVISVLK